MSTILRASVTAAALGLPSGAPAPILVDGSDTPVNANGLQGYQPTPGDRLLVQQVGQTMEVIQFVSTGTIPNQATYRQDTPPDPVSTPNGAIWYDTSNGNLPNRLEADVWVPLTLATGSFDTVDVRRTVVERGYTMSAGGTASLSSGITAPTTAPVIEAYYPVATTDAKRHTFQIPAGLTNHATDSSKMVYCSIFFGSQINVLNKAGFTNTGAALSGTWGSQFYAFNGVAQAGADYYMFGQDNNRGVAQYVYRIDGTTGNKTSELAIAGTGISYTAKPGIVSDGTNVGIVWWGGSSLYLRWYNPLTWVQVGSDILLINGAVWGFGVIDVGDLVWGDCGSGLGANTLWLAWANPSTLAVAYVWTGVTTTTFTSRSGDFPIAAATAVAGMHFDSIQGRMLHYDGTSGVNGGNGAMYLYSKLAASGSQSVTARYTYYDGDTGNYAGAPGSGTVFVNGVDVSGTASTAHETGYSPTATFATFPRRAWLRITALQAPDVLNTDPTLVDRANRHGIYTALGGGTMFRQVYTAVGTRIVDSFDTMPSSGTPDVHDFSTAQGSLGIFRSSATRLDGFPKVYIDGAGVANVDGLIPPGCTIMWLTGTIPTGWILLDGSAVSRTTYADLFAKWSTTFGAGNGTTTFNLPDMRSRIPLGAGSLTIVGGNEGDASEPDRATRFDHRHDHNALTGASGTGVTSTDATAEAGHTHSFTFAGASNTTATGASSRVTTIAGVAVTGTAVTSAGTSHAHSHNHTGPSHTHSIAQAAMAAGNIANHPFLAVNFIAKV